LSNSFSNFTIDLAINSEYVFFSFDHLIFNNLNIAVILLKVVELSFFAGAASLRAHVYKLCVDGDIEILFVLRVSS
jgi:hypothetical protein